MKVFVTGGSGFVGGYVLRALQKSGHSIRVLIRPGSEDKLPFLEGVEIAHGDVTDPVPWRERLKGIDAVIHLVGIIREFPERGVTFERMHYEATMSVLEAAVRAGVGRFLHMSANGASDAGLSAYQTTKWRAERLVEASGVGWTIFRPSVIFGDPGGKMEFASELAKVIASAPVMPIFGDGKYRLQPVFVEDVAACFVKALDSQQATGQLYHLGGADELSYEEIVQTIGKAVGKIRTRTIKAPFWMVRPVASLLGGYRWFPVTADQLDMLRAGNVCPETHYREAFGVEPARFSYQNLGYLSKTGGVKRR